MNQLLWYYADLEKRKCYHLSDLPDFDNQEKACSTWRRFAKYRKIDLHARARARTRSVILYNVAILTRVFYNNSDLS